MSLWVRLPCLMEYSAGINETQLSANLFLICQEWLVDLKKVWPYQIAFGFNKFANHPVTKLLCVRFRLLISQGSQIDPMESQVELLTNLVIRSGLRFSSSAAPLCATKIWLARNIKK